MLQAREREVVQVLKHAKVALDAIGDAVITTDKNCRITFMNPAAEMIIGILLSEAKGQFIEAVMPLRIGNNGPPHANPICISIQESRRVGLAINCQLLKQNGQWISIENSSAPLISETGEVIGGLIVFDDINEARALDLKMSHTLQYDQLTHLPNRFLFMEHLNVHLDRGRKANSKLGLILVDVDRFKLMNEEFGFVFGDTLLKNIAQHIKSQLHRNEILSRHNADEFMVLVPELDAPKRLANLAEMIKEAVMSLTNYHSGIDNFSISMGLSIYPDDADNIESLLIHADAALQRAKTDAPSDNYCFYSEEMESEFLSRHQCYKQIKNAISEQGIIALYQPIVDANTGKLIAVEALMRIKSEDGNLIPPIEFIPLAEETRLIIPLGERMIQNCFTQQKQWCEEGQTIRMCLNVSPIQFIDLNFIPFLLDAMEQYKIDPKMIELEITESLMLQNLDKVTQDLVQLRKLGITISIDDFGTGFSCLSYLKDLPVDVLKIDKSFVAQLDIEKPDEILVKTIVTLAQSMKLKSVAEGVETIQQANRIKELGVSFLQGYYFSRPVSASEIKSNYKI
jgi:diguanylate cyclase (GGDEF)-like protein/PAS domain S-box-containing protein